MRGLTQEECANALRVSARYLRRVEAGQENLSLTSLAHLARCLQSTVASLFEPPHGGAGDDKKTSAGRRKKG